MSVWLVAFLYFGLALRLAAFLHFGLALQLVAFLAFLSLRLALGLAAFLALGLTLRLAAFLVLGLAFLSFAFGLAVTPFTFGFALTSFAFGFAFRSFSSAGITAASAFLNSTVRGNAELGTVAGHRYSIIIFSDRYNICSIRFHLRTAEHDAVSCGLYLMFK